MLQQIINGLAVGGVYALIAIGWTVVFGIVGLINWTHGEVFKFIAINLDITGGRQDCPI